ncbi:hypothetical protein V6N12_066984 [Hibiscus sabdariffa]|uniref:N-acetyltransferase domain-containing protein n=1 Tax=Hibiscus sabdariffa TaxID=183260 RepID=A0ABR2AX31_9ROSI
MSTKSIADRGGSIAEVAPRSRLLPVQSRSICLAAMLLCLPFSPLHFNSSIYMMYLARWPDYFQVAEGPGKQIIGYIMGKVEGQGESWHGHVTVVIVAPDFPFGVFVLVLSSVIDKKSFRSDKAYFVHLFVRASNTPAKKMYEKLGYIIY